MSTGTETEIMPSTDVDHDNDFATESVGVTVETGLWVTDASGEQITFSAEVQYEIMCAIAQRLGYNVE